MKRYEEYKESGVEWIGKVPSHWKDCRFKNFVSLVNFPSTDENKIGLENIESGTGRFIETESEFEGNGVEYIEDDIVYGKLRPYLRKVWLATNKGNAVGDFFVFRAKRSNASYVKWLMLSDGFTSETNGSTFGAKMPRVSSDFILSLHYFLPPFSEQQSIASFLDAKTKLIDAIIFKREKQIELLEEMKSAIISRAVTKGLNPNAKMKDSGVEWIGEVPEEWTLSKIKYLIYGYKAGPFGSSLITSNLLSEGNILVYTPEHIANMTANMSNNLYLPEIRKEEMSQFIVQSGDLIFPIVGSLGRAMFVSDEMPEGIINQRLAKFRLNENMIEKNFFMYYFTKCHIVKEYIDVNSRGAIIVNLTKDIVTSMDVPLPPLSEQRTIAAYLDAETSKIDARIAKRRRQIELLQEYKQALITDAVTGKIDVREINS